MVIFMKIGIIGSGYVGLVTATCLSDFGNEVVCMDVDKEKISSLQNGKIPIYEPALDDLIERNTYYKRLSFTTDMKQTVQECDVIFIAVGTPPKDDGSADLKYVIAVAEDIGKYINRYKIIVDKSTVPVGTGQMVKNTILSELKERNESIDFDIVSNPEFLREGKAIHDFTHPDRIVIGHESEKAKETMKNVYRVLHINSTPFVFTSIETAELIKYASNAFLATKISFINEMSLLAEKVGANIQDVSKAMGMDGRISPKFLHAGAGYGGSCFPKDTQAIADIARKNGEACLVIEAAIEANNKQNHRMVDKIAGAVSSLEDKKIAILGLSFKPDTDDMREAPSLTIIPEIIKGGATVSAYCPEGMKEAEWRLESYKDSITYCKNPYEAAKDADVTVVITEWNEFRGMNLKKLKESMKGNAFVDLRNIYSKDELITQLFKYTGVGL